jgi:mRNA-degrading endonuclease toxin of MazEF toxin-antitoxin module
MVMARRQTLVHGMLDDCALGFDNLTTVPKSLLTKRITTVPDARVAELGDALRAATGC